MEESVIDQIICLGLKLCKRTLLMVTETLNDIERIVETLEKKVKESAKEKGRS